MNAGILWAVLCHPLSSQLNFTNRIIEVEFPKFSCNQAGNLMNA